MAEGDFSEKASHFLKSDNDWREYRKLVLYQLEALTGEVEELKEEARNDRAERAKLQVELNEIKVRAGTIAAIIGSASPFIIQLFQHLLSK